MVLLSGRVMTTSVADLDLRLLRRVECDRHLAQGRGDAEHRPCDRALTKCGNDAGHAHGAGCEHHRAEQQPACPAEPSRRLEPFDRGRRGTRECTSPGCGVPKRGEVRVQLGNVPARSHPRNERPPRRDRSVEQDDRPTADRVERLAPANDHPDRRQLGIGRALPVDGRRRVRLGQARAGARERGRGRGHRLPICCHLRGRLRDTLLVGGHGQRVGYARRRAGAAPGRGLRACDGLSGVLAAAVHRQLRAIRGQACVRLLECRRIR